jgi:histidinol-phosphate aminotransferase
VNDADTELAMLKHHGDSDLVAGAIDLAVNVRARMPPAWLRRRLAEADLAAYPDQRDAVTAVARRHARAEQDVLLTAGAAEAFVLIARAFSPRRAVVVHPQFTEPEAALRAAGHPVERLVLRWPFRFDGSGIAEDADLVVLGNPTNPTSVLHDARTIAALARPGRLLVVDEAFADCVPGELQSLAGQASLPGLIVVRSLTKTWGLAGVRAGYLLAEPAIVERLARAQAHWAVSTPALIATRECSQPAAVADADAWATTQAAERSNLAESLAAIKGVRVVPGARASFLLVRTPVPGIRQALLGYGFAVRRGETFPGLDSSWFRVAVRDSVTSARFAAALAAVLAAAELPAPEGISR